MKDLAGLRRDLEELIETSYAISSEPEEEVEAAFLAGREQQLTQAETDRMLAHIASVMGGTRAGVSMPQAIPAAARPVVRRARKKLSALPRYRNLRIPSFRYRRIAFAATFVLAAGFTGYFVSLAGGGTLPSGSQAVTLGESHSFNNLYHRKAAGALDLGRMNNSGSVPNAIGHGDVAPAGKSLLYQSGPAKLASASSSASSGLPSKVVHIANLTLRVARHKGKQSETKAEKYATKNGGYVVSSTQYGPGSNIDLTVRVPSSQYQKVVDEIRNLGRVTYEADTGQDVTLQFTDLGAKLANLRAQRNELLRLYGQATTVSDTIHVQQVLSGVQGQLQQTEGQIRYLANHVTYATISVEFQTNPPPPPPKPVTTQTSPVVTALSNAGRATTRVATGLVVLLGYALPLVVVALLLYGAFVLRRRYRARQGSAA
jgi:Domain of unknown function (DUF4349)